MMTSMANNPTIRCFIAIPVPSNIKTSISTLVKSIRKNQHNHAVHWSVVDNYHITLRFFSNLQTSVVTALQQQLADTLASQSPFTIGLDRLIYIPDLDKPRVLAYYVKPIGPLLKIVTGIENLVIKNGLKPETRPLLPHLTLARLKAKPKSDLVSTPVSKYEWLVESVNLYKSELNEDGAIHTVLQSYDLLSKI